ncbi:MAG: hypothetical protein Q9165_003991 [Trypethelium subeluteriae]
MARPTLLYGTSSFGMDMTDFQSCEHVKEVLQTLKKTGITHLDTAARYPPLNPGRAEQLLGEASEHTDAFVVDTKIATGTGDRSGSLSKDAIGKSVQASFERLKRQKVRILYAHGPDPTTPLLETATAFDAQLRAGHCDALGLSNYPPPLLRSYLSLCETHNLHKPTYYQGAYNILTRGMETELLPLLREHGMHFVAFWVVGAGFLTGKLIEGKAEGTRFASDNPVGAKLAENVYGSVTLRASTGRFIERVKGMDMNPLDVALRWVYWHSVLGEGDGIILGASKVRQIVENVASLEVGPLGPEVLEAVEELWQELKEERGSVL